MTAPARALAVIVAVLALRTSAVAPPALPLVVFLGQQSATADGGFKRLRDEMSRRHPDLVAQFRMSFVAAGADDASLAQALLDVRKRKPALLLAGNGHFARLARRLAPEVPLIFGTFANPVTEGVTSSLQRRPEPVTGVWISNDLDAKRLEILRDAYPGIRRVGAIGDSGWIRASQAASILPDVAQQLKLRVTILEAETPAEAVNRLREGAAAGIDAWYLPFTGATLGNIQPILSLLVELRQPAILGDTAAVHAGALMSYAVDTTFAWPALADLAARVLRGEFPGDIPIERPPRYLLAVRTGPETGLPPPQIAVVRRADLVIR